MTPLEEHLARRPAPMPWRPFATLARKEISRFIAVAIQTLAAPVVTAALYLLIFGVSLGKRIPPWTQFSYVEFITPGLILMGALNNAFANASSSLFIARYRGDIADLLVTPLRPVDYMLGYTGAALLRGTLVGLFVWVLTRFFTPLPWAHPVRAALVLGVGMAMFSQLGLLAALVAKNFEYLSMFTNFFLVPLIYLGGLFYPISDLPEPWRQISQLNPLHFLMSGFRDAILGTQELAPSLALGVPLALTVLTGVWVYRYFKMGYRMIY